MSETETETTETETETTEEEKPEEGESEDELAGLDDKAKAIVENARREAAKHRRDARAAQATADGLRKQYETLRSEHEGEQEKVIREAVDAARAEEREKWQRELLEAQVVARATGKLADPEDAMRLLSIEELLGESDPQARSKRLDQALAELLEAKPYLAASENGGERGGEKGRGLVSQGARSGQSPKGGEGSADDWLRSARDRR